MQHIFKNVRKNPIFTIILLDTFIVFQIFRSFFGDDFKWVSMVSIFKDLNAQNKNSRPSKFDSPS